MKVLIAEDSRVTRHLLVRSLTDWQFEVVEAVDGEQAWKLFQDDPVPLVVTDWIMPNLSGLELIERIRSRDWPSYVYIILLTAKSDKGDLVQAMEAGADDFLAKPFDQDELRVRVREGERIIQLEQKLADQNRQLREAQAALVQSEKLAGLGQLAAGMAHEMNNPIAYVINNVVVLKREILPLLEALATEQELAPVGAESGRPTFPEQTGGINRGDVAWLQKNMPQLIEATLGGLKRVRDLIQNLRDFARLDEAVWAECDVNQLVRSAVIMLNSQIQQKQLTLFTELTTLPMISCQAGKMNQVFYNILLNAIQASSPQQSIWVRSRIVQQSIIIETRDEGSGIAPQNLHRIFEPFFTTKPVGQGVGMGLATAYGIVSEHRGTLEVESGADRGTTFRVILPIGAN